ncbi:MAG: ABC transporter permease subunit [Actinomycetota bacterium]
MIDGADWSVIWAVVRRDLTAVRRSKPVILPMLLVPFLLMVVLPLVVGWAARSVESSEIGAEAFLDSVPRQLAEPIEALPPQAQLLTLVLGFLLAPLFMIVPLMVSAVIAADTFAGEKERRTMETLLHLPISDRDLFLAKLLTGIIPALTISWTGFLAFAVVANAVSYGKVDGLLIPNQLWLIMIFWVAPAVAMLGLGVMVRVSARSRTSQEANQLGGAVILPLIFIAVAQATGVLLISATLAAGVGSAIWLLAIFLVWRGAHQFSRDRIASAG